MLTLTLMRAGMAVRRDALALAWQARADDLTARTFLKHSQPSPPLTTVTRSSITVTRGRGRHLIW